MGKPRTAELVLGTVQLGVPYGIANRSGKPSRSHALQLVENAIAAGISTIDTARAYGDSEERLGAVLDRCPTVRTITKLSPLADLNADSPRETVRATVDASIAESSIALRRARIGCLLLHRWEHRYAFDGAVWERLLERRDDGSIEMLGVSVQTPAEALDALECRDIHHIQLPYNFLDWRWREAGVPHGAEARGDVTIHARSVFLQGLLVAEDPSFWPRVPRIDPAVAIASISALVRSFARSSAADLCLAYVRGQKWIHGVVVGMETLAQVEDNCHLFTRPPLSPAECLALEARAPRFAEQLLDPARWPPRQT